MRYSDLTMTESRALAEASGDPAAWWAMTEDAVRAEMSGVRAARAVARDGHDELQAVMRRPRKRHTGAQRR